MNSHRTDLAIESLGDAFRTAFEWTVAAERKGEVHDFPRAWVELLASALQDVRLTATPAIDADNPPLSFAQTHVIATEVFSVAGGGMRGGPTIDVLLQLWFDTEETLCGYGIPLIFRKIPNSGRMPDLTWSELQQTCRQLTLATPCAKLVFVADRRSFDWYGDGTAYWDPNPVIATDAHSFAGARLPPAPVRGRRLRPFCLDLASGWIGDPALSGIESSPIMDEVLCNFLIHRILRIRIGRETTGPR